MGRFPYTSDQERMASWIEGEKDHFRILKCCRKCEFNKKCAQYKAPGLTLMICKKHPEYEAYQKKYGG